MKYDLVLNKYVLALPNIAKYGQTWSRIAEYDRVWMVWKNMAEYGKE